MAVVAKTLGVKNASVAFAPEAIALTQTILVGKDERMCIFVDNAQAGAVNTITVKAGNGIAGVADYVIAVPQASKVIIGPLESAKFATNGVITVTASVTTTTTIGVIQL